MARAETVSSQRVTRAALRRARGYARTVCIIRVVSIECNEHGRLPRHDGLQRADGDRTRESRELSHTCGLVADLVTEDWVGAVEDAHDVLRRGERRSDSW